jgi:hypothetical protein
MGRRIATYSGESPGKSRVRGEVYRRLRLLWNEQGGDPGGLAVVLAGPEAMEVELLRDYLQLPPERVLFVDRDVEGLREAKRRWPRVPVFHGDLEDALAAVPKIAFLHLDFMGKYDRNVYRSVRAARGKILFGGVVAYTFFKGREQLQHWGFRRQKDAADKALGRPTRSFDEVRLAGTAACLSEDAALPLHFKWETSYRSQSDTTVGAPMGVMLFQHSAW